MTVAEGTREQPDRASSSAMGERTAGGTNAISLWLKLLNIGPLLILILLAAVIGLLTPNFLKPGNLSNILAQTAVIAIVAIGQHLVILTRGIDLSVGAVLVLSGMVIGMTMNAGMSIWLAIPLALGVSLLVGAINGLMIAYIGVPPFVVTLGMLSIARSLAMVLSDNRMVYQFGPDQPQLLALGGGFEIALACDLIIASEDATFALPEPRVGLAALAGGMQRLPRQIPLKTAMGLMLTGKQITAAEALRLGLANEVVPAPDLSAAAARWADEILQCSPISVRATKQVAMQSQGMRLEEALSKSYPLVGALLGSADMLEGVMAFAQKRKPEWKGK